MLKVKRFVFNIFHENTFLVWDESTKNAAVIDPGMNDEYEREAFSTFIKREALKLKYSFNTHCHIDHILGNSFIKNTYNVPIYVPQGDKFLIDIIQEQASLIGIHAADSVEPDEFINEKLELKIGNISARFISTPGHTPDEYCIYFPDEKILFSGDVLFKMSIGRTDLWGGNQNILLSSIKEKLFQLPDDVIVYPGHESSTTIGFEKENNPYVFN